MVSDQHADGLVLSVRGIRSVAARYCGFVDVAPVASPYRHGRCPVAGGTQQDWRSGVVGVMGNFRWYRRLRGGRWARVTGLMFGMRWIRVPPECVERCEEDWDLYWRESR